MKIVSLFALLASCFFWPAAQAEPVKIVNIGHGYFSGPLYAAKQEKIFEKHGLEADVSFVQGGALALQAVLTKQADVGILSYEHVLTVGARGRRLVSIYNVASRPLNNLIVDASLASGAEKLNLEDKIRRLKGKRIGLPSANGSGEKMLKMLAGKYGLQLPGDISSVYLGSEPGSYVAAFQRKLIDAAMPVEPAGVLVQQAGLGQVYLNVMSGDVAELRDLIFMTLTVHPDTIQAKPALLRKVAEAFTEATRVLKDPARGKAIMAKEYPDLSPEANESLFATMNQVWPPNGRMSEAQAQATFAYLRPEGPAKIELQQTFTNEFLPR